MNTLRLFAVLLLLVTSCSVFAKELFVIDYQLTSKEQIARGEWRKTYRLSVYNNGDFKKV